jgi:Tfp pilus assembly protein PilN
MLTLNIIPQRTKKEIGWKFTYKSLHSFLSVLILIAAIYAIIFLMLKLVMQNHFVRTVQETTIITKSTQNYTQQAEIINKEIESVYAIQMNNIRWTGLINYFASRLPEGVTLKKISADSVSGNLSIEAHAVDRKSLLLFKQLLDDTAFLKPTELPLDSLLKKEDIDFQIKTGFNSYEFSPGGQIAS